MGAFLSIVAWSLWYGIAVWRPEQCPGFDGCVERARDGSGIRLIMWLMALALAGVGIACTFEELAATPARTAVCAASAAVCLVVVFVSLGTPFPTPLRPIYGR